jgi:hypothetical protein
MTPTAQQASGRPRKKGGRTLGLLIAFLAVIAVAVSVFWPRDLPEGTLPDLSGRPVVPDDPAILDPAVIASMAPTPQVGDLRVTLDAVGLDVPLGAMTMVDDTVNPPGYDAVYWVRNLGVGLDQPADGTLYLATHALDAGGLAPGNYLTDVPLGSVLRVGPLAYRVTETRTVPKAEIGGDTGIWANSPSRVVLLTCQPGSRDNRVVTGLLLG